MAGMTLGALADQVAEALEQYGRTAPVYVLDRDVLGYDDAQEAMYTRPHNRDFYIITRER